MNIIRRLHNRLSYLIHDEPLLYVPFVLGFLIAIWIILINGLGIALVDRFLIVLSIPALGLIMYSFRNRDNYLVHPVVRSLGWILFGIWVMHWILRGM